MCFKISEFDYFKSRFWVKILIYRNIYNFISPSINNNVWNIKNLISYLIFISINSIGADGAARLGESV